MWIDFFFFILQKSKNKNIRERKIFLFSASHITIIGTYNLPPPPQKKAFFWGGMFFLNKVINVWLWVIKNFLGKNRWLVGSSSQFLADFMAFSATNPQSKFHKYCIFGYFRANLGTFFFKMRFSPKIVQKTLKMVFQSFFRSWRWLLSNFESFLIN